MVAGLTPGPWEAALLVGAAYRVWVLVALDDVLNGPRDLLLARFPGWQEPLECPWCTGFWITGVWWAAWWWWPAVTVQVAWLPAASAALGTFARFVRSDA